MAGDSSSPVPVDTRTVPILGSPVDAGIVRIRENPIDVGNVHDHGIMRGGVRIHRKSNGPEKPCPKESCPVTFLR